ncbi:MAG: acyl-CoA dehydrogenase family protein [Rhodospirillales bacterium]
MMPNRLSREELMGRARDLIPVLRERAPKTEELRRIPDETIKDFHDTGLWRMVQPARVGGAELDYGILVDLGAEIARGCPSSSWVLTNVGCHHWNLAMFPEQAQNDVWDESTDALIASSFVFPAGTAKRVDGGYRIGGRWPFSSGVDCCDWNMLCAMVEPDEQGQAPEHRIFLLHRSQYDIIDTWHAAGLRGTGSKDVAAEDIFIPEHRSLSAHDIKGGPTPGSAVNPGALYRVPVMALFPFILSGTALGAAIGAYDDCAGTTRTRAAKYNQAKIADLQSIQIKIAHADALIHAAGMLMRKPCDEGMAFAEQGEVPDMRTKVDWRRDGALSVHFCVQAVDMLFGVAGGSGLYNRNPMQRAFRDVHAVQAHIAFSMDMACAAAGRIALGLAPDNPIL